MVYVFKGFMSRRLRKTFPPGTFIPTTQRLMAIGQLCIAFSLMLWYLSQPFMGEYFALRSRMLLYEYAMGTSDILKNQQNQEKKLERQVERFEQLPESEQVLLKKDYRLLQAHAQRPAFQKILNGIQSLIRDVPPFEQAWIFFSITIAILILLKVEGAKQAAWLLPLIVLAYSFDNQLAGKNSTSPDTLLFPTEKTIVQYYLTEPLASSLLKQKEQLEKGWKHYLIENWSSKTYEDENHQLEEAEFRFTLARLKLLHGQPRSEWLNSFHEKSNPLVLFLFLIWNSLFAWVVSRSYQLKNKAANFTKMNLVNHS